MPRLLIVLAAAAALSAGCASAASNLRDVKQLLSGELSCPPDKLDVAPAGESLYSAVGCDTELTFKCNEFFGWHCSAPISDVEQAHAGTAHFDGDVGRVTEAAAGALSALGYEIAVQDAGKGLVITKRKVIQAVSTGSAATFSYQQYTVKVTADKAGGSQAAATPAYFLGEKDMTENGFNIGEVRKSWRALFKQMKTLM